MRTVRLRISTFLAAARALCASWLDRPGSPAAYAEPEADFIALAAAGLAHDLNNLLTVITANSQLGSVKCGDPAARRRWLEVQEASQVAAGLTRGLISLSRQRMLQLPAVSPNLIITNNLELLGRLAGARIAIRTLLAEDAGRILIDPTALLQVLMNLVMNARDAMPAGGTLALETRAHWQPASSNENSPLRAGGYVIVTVADTGTGMDEDTKARAFQAFFSTKPTGEGTGLGLAIVSQIVRQCGGHVSITSVPGQGTTFDLYFPEAGPVECRDRI